VALKWDDIPHVTGAQEARAGQLLLRVGCSTDKKTHRAAWLVEVAHTDSERYLNLALSFEDTPDAAKLAAEAFARTWIAAQAAALGDGGEWTSAIPKEPGWYWVRTAHDERRPGQLTPPRIELLKTNDLARYWGEPFQCWSVPVEPPPLPEPK
jgi:hypothetical protein